MKTEMNFETRQLSSLLPAEYNPRVELFPEDPEYQRIKKSIETFGYVDPIIINSDGTIIGGHQRYKVLLDLGFSEVQVVVVDLSKEDEKALNIALNKISGEWDEVKLKDLLEDLSLGDYDISVTGFQQNDLEDMINRLDLDLEAQDDDFDADAALEEIESPVTQPGDIWLLGRHRLMCGDSTKAKDVEQLLNGEQVDLVITDPPYNVDYEGKSAFLAKGGRKSVARPANKMANDNMSDDEFYSFLLSAFEEAEKAMRPGAAIYVFHGDASSTGTIFRNAFLNAGLKLAQVLIWEKNTFVLGRQDYQWRHEPILYGWKEGAAHYFVEDRSQDTVILEDDVDLEAMKKSELVAYIEKLQESYKDRTTVIFENKPTRNDVHPTMKPVPLIGKLMSNSSRRGWNVLDLFGGSGSTLMAAEQLDRAAYLMELDERYCDVIVKRWEDYTGQKAVRLNEAVRL